MSVLALAGPATAANLTWDGSTGNWDHDARWGGAEPTGADDAFIDAGAVTVDWVREQASEVYVGNTGSGTLIVEAGGELTNLLGYIGDDVGSTGTATVTGPGSTWASGIVLYVGFSGSGTLNIEANGAVTNSGGWIGVETGSIGAVTVTGSGSTWTNRAGLYIGDFGSGTMNIEAGGVVTNTFGNLGFEANSTGTVTVTGADSTWNLRALEVGRSGSGTLNVQDGGTVTNMGSGKIGMRTGSTSTVTVTGAGSTWTNSSYLYVGFSGNGTLNVEDGGTVTNTDADIGPLPTSTSTASVTGPGSTWTNTGDLYVGRYGGTVALNIQDGGSVHVGGLFSMQNIGSAALNFTITSLTDPFLDVVGDASFAGTLNVTLEAGFTLTAGDAFTLIDIGGTQMGVFDNYAQDDLLGTFNGVDLFLTYTGGDGNDVIAYTSTPLPGDTDGDGYIDNADLAVAISNFTGPQTDPPTHTKTVSDGDTDGDGAVNNGDLATSISNFTGPAPAPIPEPTSMALLTLGGLLLSRRWRG